MEVSGAHYSRTLIFILSARGRTTGSLPSTYLRARTLTPGRALTFSINELTSPRVNLVLVFRLSPSFTIIRKKRKNLS